MKYLQPTFSVPTGNGRISHTEYEIRVGLRCPKCEGLMAGAHCGVQIQNALNIDPATGKPPMTRGALLKATLGVPLTFGAIVRKSKESK